MRLKKSHKRILVKLSTFKKSEKILLNIVLSSFFALLFALGAWSIVASNAHKQFENDAQQIHESIEKEVSRYEALLLSVRSFVSSSPNITKNQFDNYLSSLNLSQYPAIDIIAVSQYIEPEQINDFYAALAQDYQNANELTEATKAVLEKRKEELLRLNASGHVVIKYISPNIKTLDYVGWSLPFPKVNRVDYERQFTKNILTSRARGLLTQEAQNDQIVSLRAGVITNAPKEMNIPTLELSPEGAQKTVKIPTGNLMGAVRMNILLNDRFFKHLATDSYLKYQVFSPEEDGKALVFDNRFNKDATTPWPKNLYQNQHNLFQVNKKFRFGERDFFLQTFASTYPPSVEGTVFIYGVGFLAFLISGILIHFAVFRKIEIYAKNRETSRQVEQLFYQANNDELTKLENRRSLFQELNANIKLDSKGQMILFFIDLDGFKYVNDNLGHQAGDELLIQYAKRLMDFIDSSFTKLYRIGGDEFVVLIDKEKSGQIWVDNTIADYARSLLGLTSDSFYIFNQRYPISQSIGVSQYPLDAKSADDLVKTADTAMYEAKKLGKNQFVLYSNDISQKNKDKIFMRSQLQKSVENNELSVVYQPKFVRQDNQYVICGAEALMRWHNEKLGPISPSIFIPIAEESGLMPEIDKFLIHEVGKNMRFMRQCGVLPFPMSINVSARQFSNIDLPEIFLGVLASYGVQAQEIIIEITEGSTMKEPAKAQKILKKFKDYGFGISIDDFGTGYSSINYLRQFPATEIKVDKSFTDDIMSDSDDRIIIEGIIQMSHKLRLNVVIEGIETPEQLNWLETHCGDNLIFQGFYFSAPLRLEEFNLFAQTHPIKK